MNFCPKYLVILTELKFFLGKRMKRPLSILSIFMISAAVCCLLLLNIKEVVASTANQPSFVGAWSSAGYEDGKSIFKRVKDLEDGGYGFFIGSEGEFIERKNIGWCGTPPISYGNFEGHWEARSDTELKITVGFWGGTQEYKLKILSANPNKLEIIKEFIAVSHDNSRR